MNLNQAKKVAGISRETVAGYESLQQAMRSCIKGIVEARRKGNDKRAAELSEAKEVFRRRLHRNTCQECGVTIGRNATHCRIHHRRKALPPAEVSPQEHRKDNGHSRIAGAPVGGMLATLGYYAKPVQNVVEKWSSELRPEWIEGCFRAIAMSVKHRSNEMKMRVATHHHWKFAAEMFTAVVQVFSDKSKPDYWLLTLPIHVQTDGALDGWRTIQKTIHNNGGGPFTVGQLKTRYSRLRLPTPEHMRADFIRGYSKTAIL